MSGKKVIVIGVALLALGVSACGVLMGTPEPGAEVPDEVATAVQQAVSAAANVEVEEVEILEAEEREWPNACLGLAEEGEVCAEVITPGWEVRVEAGGEEYVVRTDEEGTTVRIE